MRGFELEHILGALLELRDTERFEKKVTLLIKSRGWSHVTDALQRCRDSDAIVPGWDTHLREGILREGLITLLHLEAFEGLDVDFLEAFSNIEVEDIHSLRIQVRVRAIELLREQVQRGNTFFMDVESMKNDDLVVFVPDIIDSRTIEIQNLSRKPDLYDVYSTYYGFQVLTAKVHIQGAGIPSNIHEKLYEILNELGGIEVLKSKQLKFSPHAFRNCSSHLNVLLFNMLRLANGGAKAKLKSLEVLGELGDSRAINLIHSYFENHWYSDQRMIGHQLFEKCLLCLGRIGSPHSFDLMRKTASGEFSLVASIALAGIRHPEVIQALDNLFRNARISILYHLNILSKTRSRYWLSTYEALKQVHRSNIIIQAIEYAERNVHPPFDDLR
ncbi:MAG: hypothetical protein ACTSYJ_02910 [Candidatus Thorarchaeota archaeon]